MSFDFVMIQALNGIQFGMLLFLLAAGLTLVLGIMDVVNLSHGATFMMGAYFGVTAAERTGSVLLAVLAAVLGAALVGLLIEWLVIRRLYRRGHLDQVLATFGVILVANELTRGVWGPQARAAEVPAWLSGTVELFGISYPEYRLALIVLGLLVAAVLYVVIHSSPVGMLIRAGASDPAMLDALGVNTRRLYVLVFGSGAALAGLAGFAAAPLMAVQSGMGEPVLVLALVVIVTGGIGSVQGAFFGALLIGLTDALGRAFFPMLLETLTGPLVASTLGPALASTLMYLLLALVLTIKPSGLFGGRHA